MHSQNSLLHHPSPIPSSSSSFSPSTILFFLSYLCWPRLLGVVRFCHNHLGDWGLVPMADLSWVEERRIEDERMRGWEKKNFDGGGVLRWAVEDSLAGGGDDGLSGSAPANVRGQPWLCLNHNRAVDARQSGEERIDGWNAFLFSAAFSRPHWLHSEARGAPMSHPVGV